MGDGLRCAICMNGLSRRGNHKLECGHKFHQKCLDEMVKHNPEDMKCPLCRAQIIIPTNENCIDEQDEMGLVFMERLEKKKKKKRFDKVD